jgi:hypothetical protein
MTDFSARDALLAGPRLVRRRPDAVGGWVVLLLLLTLLTAFMAQEFQAYIRSAVAAGQSLADLDRASAVVVAARWLLSTVVQAVVWTSALRTLMRPSGRPFELGLGRAEFRVAVVQTIAVLIANLVLLVAPRVTMRNHATAEFWLAGFPLLQAFLLTGAGLWGAVAGAWALDQDRIAPFGAWKAFKGRAWRMAGLYLAAMMILGLIEAGPGLVIALGRSGPGAPTGLAVLNVALDPLNAPLSAMADPVILLRIVWAALLDAAIVAAGAGIVVSAYRGPEAEKE